ncbi:MAG: ATP-grasp domain-containing protein [Methylomonas sp.]
MKILIFEYICGGGCAGQPMPAGLAAEGRMMLQALVADLASVADLELLIPLDVRFLDLQLPASVQIHEIVAYKNVMAQLRALIAACDAVWPIAPETDGILAVIAAMIKEEGKILLLSPAETVALCADKLATYQALTSRGIPCIETHLLCAGAEFPENGDRVVKPRDGCGCQGNRIVGSAGEFSELLAEIQAPEQYVIQPYQAGQAGSLSCLFKHGRGWLICFNLQQIGMENRRFKLQACQVNAASPYLNNYPALVAQIAVALPGLWGYVGIDLIETREHGPLILEINPRLTSSYIGIRQATGINTAAKVLAMLTAEPQLRMNRNHSVTVQINAF